MTTTTTERAAAATPEPDRPAGPVLRLARWSIRHRVKAVIGWFVFVALIFLAGDLAGTRLLTAADSGVGESGRADRVIERAGFDADWTERVLIGPRTGSGALDLAAAQAAAADLVAQLTPMTEVASVGELIPSVDGTAAIVPVVIDVDGATGNEAVSKAADRVPAILKATDAVSRGHPDLRIEQVGDASLEVAVSDQVAADFVRAEKLSLPITLVILLLTFGALIAAGVPLVLAVSAVAAAIGLSALVSHLLPVMDALNSVILLIGMAVGVDYSLFYVRRAREERDRGQSRADAIEVAARTSGRAVVVSGLAVFVAMSGLLLTGDATFVSMGVGTMLVVAVAVLGSLTVLPAMLSLLGDRIDRPRVPFVHRLRRRDGAGRFWPALMRVVLHKPVVSLLLAGLAMLALALPALGMRTGEAGADSLPRSIPVIKTYDAMTKAFPQNGFAHPIAVWSPDGTVLDGPALQAGVDDLTVAAERSGQFAPLTDVAAQVAPDRRTATIDLPVTGDFNSERAQASLRLVREELAPLAVQGLPGAEVASTGPTAYVIDFGKNMGTVLPWVMAFVLGLTFIVLVVSFRSIVIAATAVVLNLLSVATAYGLLVLVFQHGFGEKLLGFEGNGTVIDWLPLFLFVVLFGLSMDYHVFVVSRVREAYLSGLPTKAAVAHGVTASAGVVTSAAAVMVGVFSIFGTLSLLEFKQLGLGLAAAVLIDATIVRAVLLPAAMTVLGRHNWWLPGWLDKRLPAAH